MTLRFCITIPIILISILAVSQEEKTVQLNFGFGVENSLYTSNTRNENLKYFTSNYSRGNNTSFLLKGRLGIKKWHMSLDLGYGFMFQKQNIVFSSSIDRIIDFDVKHSISQWQINYGIGRSFILNQKSSIIIELGATTYGFYKGTVPSNDISGSFESEYINPADHWADESSIENYSYTISYAGHASISPWLKFGLVQKFELIGFEYGLLFLHKRMEYENFIILKSNSYSAIANSRSKSNAIGLYINLFF